MKRILYSPDPAPSSGPDPVPDPAKPPTNPPGAPSPTLPDPKDPDPSQAPPPAALVVTKGTKTVREVELEKRVNDLEDENRQLKTPPPKVQPQVPPAKSKKSWHSGGTFFHEPDSD